MGAMQGAVLIALAPERWRAPALPLLLAYSARTMLAAALLSNDAQSRDHLATYANWQAFDF